MKILLIVCLLFFQLSYAQVLKQQVEKPCFWTTIWGDSPENGFKFLPLATHFQQSENPFFHGAFYTAANYKSWELSAFNNSYNDFSISLFYLRKIKLTERFSIDYGAGFLCGYRGRLQKVEAIPFNNTFLYSGNLNPTYGIGFEYNLSKKIAISAMSNPAVIIYGLKYFW